MTEFEGKLILAIAGIMSGSVGLALFIDAFPGMLDGTGGGPVYTGALMVVVSVIALMIAFDGAHFKDK